MLGSTQLFCFCFLVSKQTGRYWRSYTHEGFSLSFSSLSIAFLSLFMSCSSLSSLFFTYISLSLFFFFVSLPFPLYFLFFLSLYMYYPEPFFGFTSFFLFQKIRTELKCKSFQWFLDTVYPECWINVIKKPLHKGLLRNSLTDKCYNPQRHIMENVCIYINIYIYIYIYIYILHIVPRQI